MPGLSHKKLKVWQISVCFVASIYKLTHTFPKEEIYGITSQLRRAAVSIPANLAEGCGRSGDAKLARFAQISMGSACELEYHIMLSHDLQYINDEQNKSLSSQVIEIKQMLSSFIQKLKAEY